MPTTAATRAPLTVTAHEYGGLSVEAVRDLIGEVVVRRSQRTPLLLTTHIQTAVTPITSRPYRREDGGLTLADLPHASLVQQGHH